MVKYYLVLFTVVCSTLIGIRSELSNSLPNSYSPDGGYDSVGREECDRLEEHVRSADLSTNSDFPPKLHGKWVSEGCEVRPGPEYILRSYTFSKNHTFRLLQFHYSDPHCTSPQWAVLAKGKLRVRGRSWVTPGGTETDYTLHKVSVLAHKPLAAADLARKVNESCPGTARRRWRTFREYVVLNIPDDDTPEIHSTSWEYLRTGNVAHHKPKPSRQHRSHPDDDFDCTEGILPASFHELQLLRSQTRPAGAPDSRESRFELLTGDIHARPDMRYSYRPTAYQPPLLKSDQTGDCTLCREVARASERSPPHLPARARLPVFLTGEWISPRCEVRPLGMFVKRRLRFNQQRGRKWTGEFRFYSDAACSHTTMVTHASGRFSNDRPSTKVEAGTELEFRIDTAALAIYDEGMLNALNSAPNNYCGSKNRWELEVIQDVTSTGGCDALGVTVPVIEKELLKLEMDSNGNSLLYIGQIDPDKGKHEDEFFRPTAYQSPLIQCKSNDDVLILTNHIHRSLPPVVMTSNQLFPMPHARIALNIANKVVETSLVVYSLLISVFIVYFMN